MTHLLLIGAGGFLGAVARYVIDGGVMRLTGSALPWGTFVVNISGSFLIGLLFAVATERTVLPAELRGPLMIGVLGSYTTFSTLTLESWRMVEEGAWLQVGANLLGSVVVGMIAVFAGVVIGRLL